MGRHTTVRCKLMHVLTQGVRKRCRNFLMHPK